MRTTWIVAANNNRARIFEMRGAYQDFQEIEDFVNPAGDMDQQDLRTDAKGRFYGKGEREQGHTAEPNTDAVQHETERFSKAVSEYLDKARLEQRYDRLYLIAFPKFLGVMRQNLSKEVQKLVEEEMSKDISKLDAREIEAYVKNKLH